MNINAGADDYSMCSSCFPKYHLFNAPFTRVDEFEGAPAESAGPNAVGWAGVATQMMRIRAPRLKTPHRHLYRSLLRSSRLRLSSPPFSIIISHGISAGCCGASFTCWGALTLSKSARDTAGNSTPSERATSLVASPRSVPSTAGTTKEEKVAKMARRKEERKQVCLVFSFSFTRYLNGHAGACVGGGFSVKGRGIGNFALVHSILLRT
jgi:hypothetical protein